MIPEEHRPAVRMACDALIFAAYDTNADVAEFSEWVSKEIEEFYGYYATKKEVI